jgi:hypothetical protein
MDCCLAGDYAETQILAQLDDDFTLTGICLRHGSSITSFGTDWLNATLLLWRTNAPPFGRPVENLTLRKLSADAALAALEALHLRSIARLCGAVHIEYGVQIALGWPVLPLRKEHAKRWVPGVGGLFLYLHPTILLNDLATIQGDGYLPI